MDRVVEPAPCPLSGALRVPGDKSVSHRALVMAAMAKGSSRITGLLDSDDVGATAAAVVALGAESESLDGVVEVTGWGGSGPRSPEAPIDCGNSGTTVRLLAGVVAGWPVTATFTGDDSLRSRPMERVAEPLRKMGASVTTTAGHLPMTVTGGVLRALDYVSPVASAQVKTLVLLAGTRADGRTSVTEPAVSRDHTERMLPGFGVRVDRSADMVRTWVDGPMVPHGCDVDVPGDPSSAAFFAAAAAAVPGSTVRLDGVMLNPTRTAAIEVLRRMGAPVAIDRRGTAAGEEVGSITVSSAPAPRAVLVREDEVPALIDEIPVLAVAASRASGVSRFEGVGELRVKESDRLEAVGSALRALGATVRWGKDWLEVEGPVRLHGATLDSLGDHRLAMAFHVAGLSASGPVTIERYDAVSVSYPGFADDLAGLCGS